VLVKVEPFRPGPGAGHTAARMVPAGEQFSPRGRAHRLDIKVLDARAPSSASESRCGVSSFGLPCSDRSPQP
jgi:hypothetical protein